MRRITLNEYLRTALVPWTNQVLMEHEGRCLITGTRHKVQIHHAVPFYKVRDQALQNLELPYRKFKHQYTSSQLLCLSKEVQRLHENINGYPIRKRFHEQFHQTYGPDASEDVFLSFVVRKRAAHS